MDFTLKWVLLYGVLPTLVYIAIGLYILSLEHIKKRPGYKLPALIYFISVPSLIVIIIILTFSMNYVSGRYESANKPTGYELYKFLVLKDIIPRSDQSLDEEKTTQTAKVTQTETTQTVEKVKFNEIDLKNKKKLKFTEHGSFYGIKKDGKMIRGIQIGPETDTGQSTWYGAFTKSQGYWKGYFAHSYPDGRKLYNYSHYKLDSDGNLIVDKDGIYEFVDTYPISEKDFEKVKEYIFLDMDFPFSFYDFEELKPKITVNIEKIEKMYADGSITKAECIKAKSIALKLPSVSKTICNNVVNKIGATAEAAVETAVKQAGAEEKRKTEEKKVAKKESKKKVKKIAKKYDEELQAIDKYESSIPKESSDFEPPKGERDLTPPTIKVASMIESKEPNYFIEGTVVDTGGSKKGPYLYVDDEKIELDKNGKFSVRKYSPTNDQITIVAYDGNGNVTEKFVNVIIISSKKGKYYALIIGNNDYQHLEKLDAAENDAREIGKVLESKYEFEVTHLYNATRKDTVSGMHYISRKLNNEDSLLIYYAGHGIFDKDEDEGYWLPVDATKDTSAEGIGNAWITKQVRATKARHVLLLIDSCFAGSITKTRSASNLVPREKLDLRFIERKSSKKSRMVITSGGNEPVVDSDGGDHSWFAKKLLEILNENNDVIYSLNIYDELQKYVINNADQTPVMAAIKGTGHNEGEFFFYSKN